MWKYLVLLIFLPLFARSQILARYDVEGVEEITTTTWLLTGTISDLTGSYTGLDVTEGNKIVMRGVNSFGQVVFDRFVVDSIISATITDVSVYVKSDMDGGYILNNFGVPFTGKFPLGTALSVSKLMLKPSYYQTQFDPDYDAGIDNLNLQEVQPRKYEYKVSNDDENNWILPFVLQSTSVVIYNGSALQEDDWDGIDSNILTLHINVNQFDNLMITN